MQRTNAFYIQCISLDGSRGGKGTPQAVRPRASVARVASTPAETSSVPDYSISQAAVNGGEEGGMEIDLRPVDWNALYYGVPNLSCLEIPARTTLVHSMTVLAGSYLDGASDVFLIADRRSVPRNAVGISPVENARKILRLGDECAIGFSGAIPLHNAVLAKLLGIPQPGPHVDLLSGLAEDDGRFDIAFDDVVGTLKWLVPIVVERLAPPTGITMRILVAGRMVGDIPVLATCGEETGWEFRPALGGYVSSPVTEDDPAWHELKEIVDATDSSPVESMKAAIAFCAERYDDVNRHYTLRRLSNGFRREEGVV